MPREVFTPQPPSAGYRRAITAACALFALHVALGTAAQAGTVAAYMYTQSGAAGVPTLAALKPSGIGEVYLKGVDIDPQGGVHVKLDDSGRFFPHAWTATPRPTFACLVNADPTFTWTAVDPTSPLTSALSTNSWHQDYGGGITADAEFSADIQSFPATWQSCMTALRALANAQNGNFSLYVSPKYLSSSRYPSTAAGNAAALASILGTAPSGAANTLLFPVYDGNGGNVDEATLTAAAAAAHAHGLGYTWIFDITESPATFTTGLQRAAAANTAAGAVPAGYAVYSYIDSSPVTADMTTNLQAVLDVAFVPEPAAAALLVGLSLAALLMVPRSRLLRLQRHVPAVRHPARPRPGP